MSGTGFAAAEPEKKQRVEKSQEPGTLSPGTAELAARLVDHLAPPGDTPFESVTDTVMYLQDQHHLELADVHESLDRYGVQEAMLRQYDIPTPCLEERDDMPIPIAVIPVQMIASPSDIDESFVARQALEAAYLWQPFHVSHYPPSDARAFLRHHLTKFLDQRLAGRGVIPPSQPPSDTTAAGPPPESDYPLQVETPGRPGLLVYYGMAYFADSRRFGGTLSTPVLGRIPAGRYKFGARAERAQVEWDVTGTYDVPRDPPLIQLVP